MRKLFMALFLLLYFSTSVYAIDVTRHTVGGNVTGPVTGTDNAIPRFDKSGKKIQNSSVTIDDSNNMTIPGGQDLATSATKTYYHTIKSSAVEGLAGEDLRIGLDESNRTLIIADRGDIGTDFGLTAATSPTLRIYNAAGTSSANLQAGTISGISTISGNTTLGFYYTGDIATSPIFHFTQSATDKELTASAINQAFMSLTPEYLQTDTASATDLLIAPVISSIGSGESIGLQISRGTFATADTVNSTNSMIKIDGTLGILDGTDIWNGLKIAPVDTANHTGGSINGIAFGSITNDAQATEVRINLSETTPSWDADLIRSSKAITCATNVCTDVAGAYAVYITTESDATPDVLAIADGIAGQEKLIILKGAGTDDLTITPAHYGSGTSITCTTTGFSAKLHFDGTSWQVVSLFGCTDD